MINQLVEDLVTLILLGAVGTHPDSYQPLFIDAYRQLHWTLHGIESKYTRRPECGRIDGDWWCGGYSTHRLCCDDGELHGEPRKDLVYRLPEGTFARC